MKGREIVTLMKNVWAISCAETTTVLVLHSAATMTAADNHGEMKEKIV